MKEILPCGFPHIIAPDWKPAPFPGRLGIASDTEPDKQDPKRCPTQR